MVSTSDDREPDDALVEDQLSELLSPVGEKIVREIEQKRLGGWTERACITYARDELGVPEPLARRYLAIIHKSWETRTKTYDEICRQRDLVRARMWAVYEMAFSDGDAKHALKALEAIAKLDGVNHVGSIDGEISSGHITNHARDNVMTLIHKMRTLAHAHAGQLTPGNTVEVSSGNGHSNGKNGKHHAVIDVDDEDEEDN